MSQHKSPYNCCATELQSLVCPAIHCSAGQADIPDASPLIRCCVTYGAGWAAESRVHSQEQLFTPNRGDQSPNSKKTEGLVLECSSAFTGVSVDMKRLFSLVEKGVTKTGGWKLMSNEFKLS